MPMDLSRFGAVEHDWHMQLHMPAGLLGFPEVKEYLIVDPAPELPVKWLQARDALHLAFVIADPFIVLPDYRVELTSLDLMDVGAHATADLFLVAAMGRGIEMAIARPDRAFDRLRAGVFLQPHRAEADNRDTRAMRLDEFHGCLRGIVAGRY